MSEIYETAVKYLKDNKKTFLDRYVSGIQKIEPKIAIFTAGASGAGKTEYAIDRISKEQFLLHIDIDKVRDFFEPVGYDGSNSSNYQRPASKGVEWLLDMAIKKEYSLILDSNFAEFEIAQKNIQRLLNKSYIVEINYIYREIEKCYEFAKQRESQTKRVVPMEVVISSLKRSFDTTLMIKKIYGDVVILNLFDRKNSIRYDDINEIEFYEKLYKEFL